MESQEIIIIIQYLTLMELDIHAPISEEIIQKEYRRLAKIYHPDVANLRYKDGNKFKELNAARAYLITNLDKVNNYISKGFYRAFDPYEAERRRREEAARRAAEEENKRREEAERRRREEALRKAEEEKRRKEAEVQRAAEERARINREKKKIELELKSRLDSIDKSQYYEEDLKKIVSLITSYINKLPSMYHYKSEYLELLKKLKCIKTVKDYQKIKFYKKILFIASSSLIVLIIFFIFLFELIIPTVKYNSAFDCINNKEYNKAEMIFNELDGFKDSDLQIELLNIYSLLNENQYRDAIVLFENKGGSISVNYNTDGGDLKDTSKLTKSFELKACSKKGYYFIDYIVESYKINTKKGLNLELKLKAKYEVIEYKITYDLNNGTLENSNPLTYNIETEEFVLLSPDKSGYNFEGWFNENNEYIISIEKGSIGNINLTAKYSPIIYEIVYELNGGHNENNNVFNYNIESDTINLKSPNKLGYSFKGWTIGEGQHLYKEYSILNGSIGDIKLTAHWEANEYNIIYKLNGGINNPSNPDGYIHDNGDIKIYDPSKEGYSFEGWITSEDNGPVKEYIIPNGTLGDVELVAMFKANKYNIIFDVNGGDEQFEDSMLVTFDSEYHLGKPTKIAYEFVSWNYKGSIFEQSGIYDIAGDITLTATWKPINYKITYELDNGINAINNPIEYNVEENITLLPPTKIGYNFIGWSTKENQVPNLNYIIPLNSHGDITITANFKPMMFKITYDVNTGDELNSNIQNVEYDEIITTYTPTKTGYSFEGWYIKNNLFDVYKWNYLEDVELVAKWTPNKYIIEIVDEVTNKFEITYDSSYLIENPLKNNYIFNGYYSAPYGKGTKYTNEFGDSLIKYQHEYDIKLYPYYQYKVDFITNGGDEISSKILDENVLPNDVIPLKSNKTFGGWFTDISLNNEFTNVRGNITLYARWNEETPTNLFTIKINELGIDIVKYNGNDSKVVIPNYIGGKIVNNILNSAFFENAYLNEIILQEGMSNLGDFAFYMCSNLSNVVLPNSLINIGYLAFGYCGSLEEIIIPNSVTSLSQDILLGCPLKKLTIPFVGKNVDDQSYESGNIGYITSSSVLKEITLSKSISFGTAAFEGLTSLEAIQLPETHRSISSHCFFGCNKLVNISLPDSIVYIGEYAFTGCSSLEQIIIPAGVKRLEEFSFASCKNLKDVKILSELISLGSGTFIDCYIEKMESPLQTTFLSNSGERFEDPFNHNVKEFILTSGNLKENIGSILPRCEKVFIPDNIKGYCGKGVGAIKEISIPNLEIFNNVLNGSADTVIIRNLNSLSNSNFGDFGARKIILPDNLLDIEGNPFIDISKLEEIVIDNRKYKSIDGVLYTSDFKTLIAYPRGKQDSVYEINSQTRIINFDSFGSNIYLNNIIIPDEIEVFDDAFDLIHNLNGNIKDNLKYIGSYNNPYLILMESLTESGSGEISDDTKFIYKYCFENKYFGSITLPARISYIGYNAFLKCDELDDVYFKGTLEDWCKINFCGPYANPMYYADHFYLLDTNDNYYEVTEIEIPSTIKRVNEYTFNGFNHLEKMIVPNSVEYISYRAFYNCDSLNSISIPFIGSGPNDEVNTSLGYLFGKYPQFLDEVYVTNSTKIYDNAFKGLTSVRKIEFMQPVDFIGDYSFYNCYNLETLNINFSVNSVGNYAFYNCNLLEKIEFDENLNTVGDYSFANCYSIEELNLYNSNQYGISAFDSCKSLKYFYGSCLSGKNSMFFNCHSLIFISIKDYQSVQYKPGVCPKALFMLFSFDKSSDSNLWKLQGLEYRHGGVDGHLIYGYVPKSLKFLKIENLPTGKYGYNIDTQPYDICSCDIEYIIIEKDMILKKYYWTNVNAEILFEGNMNDWNGQLKIQPTYRGELVSYDKNNIYFYSEERPLDVGKYWRYVDGIPVLW